LLVSREKDSLPAVCAHFPEGVDALIDLVSRAPGVYDGALKSGARVAST